MDYERCGKRMTRWAAILTPFYLFSIYLIAEKYGYFKQSDGTGEEQTAVPASEATLSTLKQKCAGKSYSIAIEDHPGRATFHYDSLVGSFEVTLGLSQAGVQECETYKDHNCVAYKSDFAPSKWAYWDNNADGLVDIVTSYKQNRDGTEEPLDLWRRTKPTPEENAVYVRNLEYFSKISQETTSSLVKVAPCY